MPKPGRLAKKVPPWTKLAPKQLERQTESKVRQTAKASGLKTKTKA